MRLLAEAFKTFGVHEYDGPADNPLILRFAKELGIEDRFQHDDQAWCTLWFWAMANRAGLPIAPKHLLLWSWYVAKWGTERQGDPEMGDVVVTWRGDRSQQLGHVQIFLAPAVEDRGWLVIGGNQSNTVSIIDRRIGPHNLVSVRIPPEPTRPEDGLSIRQLDRALSAA
jgi:hypothetical protein